MPRTVALAVLVALAPAALGDSPFDRIEPEIAAAIARDELPGAIVLVLHKNQVVYRRAFGLRAKEPVEARMTADTVFDLASLTKPVATATSLFTLVEQGKLKLDDPMAKYWPAFAANGKDKVTIEQCLLHVSGLTADNAESDYADGKAKALERIAALKLQSEPGRRFRYSDVGFIVLGHLIELIAGESLDAVARKRIFEPLGMKHTGFRPKSTLVAPTTREDGAWLAGTVHDPRARRMGGVAGHAGLFGTADDLAIYCRMVLNRGELGGKRVLKPETMALFTEPRPVPGGLRTRGWDCDTSYSANRGEHFPKGKSFGHTGFTGTSIWIDPESQTAVIFLSNRVHPAGKGNVTKLRGRVATLAAEALKLNPPR
jgi:CubicO group peptidase (beta-lactamase class C family)